MSREVVDIQLTTDCGPESVPFNVRVALDEIHLSHVSVTQVVLGSIHTQFCQFDSIYDGRSDVKLLIISINSLVLIV